MLLFKCVLLSLFKHADVEKYFIQNSPALKENQRGFAD